MSLKHRTEDEENFGKLFAACLEVKFGLPPSEAEKVTNGLLRVVDYTDRAFSRFDRRVDGLVKRIERNVRRNG